MKLLAIFPKRNGFILFFFFFLHFTEKGTNFVTRGL